MLRSACLTRSPDEREPSWRGTQTQNTAHPPYAHRHTLLIMQHEPGSNLSDPGSCCM